MNVRKNIMIGIKTVAESVLVLDYVEGADA